MSTRASKKRKLNRNDLSTGHPPAFPGDPAEEATDEDRKKWNGWCEIESEPALFNVMLKKLGVTGVKVIEPDVPLEAGLFLEHNRPVYGLIFLFRWREDESVERERQTSNEIWFANQTATNACASVALLNIINNVPDINLGEPLQQFNNFTSDFSPALRGDAIANFQFLKEVHNSFARKMDMLTSDLALKNEVAAASRKRKASKQDDTESSFHFIAFVPIGGEMWKLDGLDREPYSIGLLETEDWLEQVKPELASRMDGGTEAAVFGLVRDPLAQLMDSLAQKSRGIDATLGRLDVLDPNWECFAAAYDGLGKRLSDFKSIRVSLNADRNHDNTKAHSSSAQELTADCIDQLLGELQQQLNAHSKLFEQLSREEESNKQDEDRIAARAKDFGPAIRLWLKFHARKGLVKNLLDTASSTR